MQIINAVFFHMFVDIGKQISNKQLNVRCLRFSPGCQFGDRALQCDTRIQDRDCYKLDVRNDCCKTCKTIEDKYFSGQ